MFEFVRLSRYLGPIAVLLVALPASLAAQTPAAVPSADPTAVAAPAPVSAVVAAPAPVTPTAAIAVREAMAPRGPCRPGTPGVALHSDKVQWTVSPCYGGIESIRLLDPQFKLAGRTSPAANPPSWAAAKFEAGPLELVDSWDAKWDPFRDFFDSVEAGDQPITAKADGSLLAKRLKDYALLDSVWGVVEKTDHSVALAWPDPQRVVSPIYMLKRYSLAAKDLPHSLQLEVSVYNVGNAQATVTLVHDLTTFQGEHKSGGLMAMFSSPPDLKGAAMLVGDKTVRFDSNSLASAELADRTRVGKPAWLGVDSRYFLLASAPDRGFSEQNDARLQAVGNGVVVARLKLAPATLGVAQNGCVDAALAAAIGHPACSKDQKIAHGQTWVWGLYTGPKDVDLLRPAKADLVETIDFGWFGTIARPMLAVLAWGFSVSGSWPVAILLLTVLVKALLWPVTMRSMRSMKKMSRLKPEIDKGRADLEARAKKLGKPVDPNELNRVTFDLYKQHGVNPVGGCFPLLLQMPVYIALYRSINASVSLYNQPLFLWIGDMTQKDPYYVLPLVLGVVMFLQQKWTPQAAGGDPAQQKMMLYFMPVLFTAMMLGLPSGLTLYILINTVLSLVQTLVMQRSDVPAGKPAT